MGGLTRITTTSSSTRTTTIASITSTKLWMIMLLSSSVLLCLKQFPTPVAGWVQQRLPLLRHRATTAAASPKRPCCPRTALFGTSQAFKYSNDHIRLAALRSSKNNNHNNQDGSSSSQSNNKNSHKPMKHSTYSKVGNSGSSVGGSNNTSRRHSDMQNGTSTSTTTTTTTSKNSTPVGCSVKTIESSSGTVIRKISSSNLTGDLNGELVEMELEHQQVELVDHNNNVFLKDSSGGGGDSSRFESATETVTTIITGNITASSDTIVDMQVPRLDDKVSVLSVDPAHVDVYQRNMTNADRLEECNIVNVGDMFSNRHFVEMFRGSANYIASHRNSLVVYHIPGDLMDENPNTFRDLMNDISLSWLLGMRIVIVVGCKYQVEKRLQKRELHKGMVVTDPESLRVVKEEAGYVRFEVERQLARALKGSRSGGGNGSDGGEGNVVSGNFYSAQPFGVLDGVDYKFSGFVRKMESEKIQQVLKNRDIVLLTTLGFSPTGEVFNVNSEYLASFAGGSLNASKLIYFLEKDVAMRHKIHGTNIPHLRVHDGQKLLELSGVRTETKGFVYLDDCPYDDAEASFLVKMGWGMHALKSGVKRVHLVSPEHGALLQELYTRDGAGTMISGDLYDGILAATVRDVTAIHDLITPLIERGTLVERTKATLERDIEQYHVYTRDGLIVACGQLKTFENGYAEIGCLVVNAAYRAKGRGDAMLGYLERLCVQNGATIVFVLSTQTMEWFIERGFDQVGVDMLPPSRQATYNHERASKIYMKRITSVRDLDASELFWDR